MRTLDAVRGSLRAADRALVAAEEQGRAAFDAFLARLRTFRVLDPACGSGNFLYLALVELKNIERRAVRTAIRAALAKGRMSASAVCKEAGVAEKSLRNFLDGDTETFRLDTLVRVARVLGISVGELIGEPQPAASEVAPDAVSGRA